MATVTSIASIAYPNGIVTEEQGGSWSTHTSFARPADTAAYAAGDVISNSTSTAASLYFPTTGLNGELMSAHVIHEDPLMAACNLELLIFDSAPADHLDNAALACVTGNLPYLVHRFNFLAAASVLIGSNLRHYTADGTNALQMGRCYAGSTVGLYGLLVTRTIVTPNSTSAAKFHVRLSLRSW